MMKLNVSLHRMALVCAYQSFAPNIVQMNEKRWQTCGTIRKIVRIHDVTRTAFTPRLMMYFCQSSRQPVHKSFSTTQVFVTEIDITSSIKCDGDRFQRFSSIFHGLNCSMVPKWLHSSCTICILFIWKYIIQCSTASDQLEFSLISR